MKKINNMTKIRQILGDLITEDDKGRDMFDYDVGKTLDKAEKRILNLKLKDLKEGVK